MDKEDVARTHARTHAHAHTHARTHTHRNITQPQKKNEILPPAATWMDPEIIVLKEVSQMRKTNIISYCLYVESKKKDTN